ncbi:MAG: hypothetical protein LBQ22_04185 [Bacteroidales bacterium]|jgi:hypothetical protein|nr:hypothetical protein [Bacteroidales bacterium]
MKKLVLLLIIIVLSVFKLSSQVNPEDESRKGGGFASLNFGFNSIDQEFAFFTGGSGGFIVKDIRLGVFFNGLTSNTKIKDDETDNEYKVSCAYGGIYAGYPLWKSKRFHGLADLKILIGNINTVNADNYERGNNSLYYGLVPSIGIEYYLNDIFAISLGVEYRHCFFPDEPAFYDSTSLNSVGACFSIKFGHFGW